ncbi:MAG TPA: ABC transporter ATP-binding protein, partial [Bacteroidetes bacterium]|nr:ABC transporter ATP-binding protein [Bacteroidota bacterium]
FVVKKGEKVGIIGESGSGKTTLMNLLLRFLVEQDGGIYVDGKKLLPADHGGWRDLIGYVQQGVFLMDASLKENVAFGEKLEDIDPKRLRNALEQASLLTLVDTMPAGWDTRIGEMGAMLSGGQRQRIGIARALYWNSQILVFDEATSALDMDTEQAITESIEALSQGQTLFVIAHRITTLRHCDRILEMKNGKLVGTYTYEELIRSKMG